MPSSLFKTESESVCLKASPAERHELGRSYRETAPLEAQLEAALTSARPDPLEILAAQDTSRLAELIPLRYGRMSRTPFTFLRGAAAVMASDLASGVRSNIPVELCGDAHLGNFRWYFAPNRELVFDLNDFDETLPGPFEWDVKRLAASIMVAARVSGFSSRKSGTATRAAMREYRRAIAHTSKLSPLDLHYYRFESKDALKDIEKHGKSHREWKQGVLKKATRKNSLRAFKKLTAQVDGRRMIVSDPPLIVRIEDEMAEAEIRAMQAFVNRYRDSLSPVQRILFDRFKLIDIAKKVVGVGSVGTRCMLLLFVSGDGTPLFLQFKQATASVLEKHLGECEFNQSGQRVVEGQRLIQATSDTMLGWSRWKQADGKEIDFYFRQLWDGKGKIDVERLDPERLKAYAALCGKALALAHARSGDAMMIRGYIGDDKTFEKVLVEYANRYASITETDYMQLSEAIKDGAIEVLLDL